SITMAWGTNHNFFNTEWQQSDSFGCSGHEPISGEGPVSEAQQKVAISTATSFFLANVGEKKDETFLGNFDPTSDQPATLTGVTRVDRDHYYTYDDGYSIRVDDFDRATGTSSSGDANLAKGITIRNDANEIPKRAEIEWKTASPETYLQVNWTPDGKGHDVAAYSSLDFRVSRQMPHMGSKDATDFSVVLVHDTGALSNPVSLSSYLEFVGPASTNVVYQTVRVPMADFGLGANAKIRGVKFVFDKSVSGAIYLTNVRFTVNDQNAFKISLGDALPEFEGPNTPATPVAVEPATPAPGGQTVNPAPPPNAPTNPVNVANPVQPAPRPPIEQATLVKMTAVKRARQLGGAPAFEIAVHAKNGFPVQNALPTLVMDRYKFFVSRYANHKNDTLIFSVPKRMLDVLPKKGKMHVQYGHREAGRTWQMPDFDKSRLAQ
ncbi:MAG: hypothetical protein AAB250_12085, partial [Bdellovibrionota bacterium]